MGRPARVSPRQLSAVGNSASDAPHRPSIPVEAGGQQRSAFAVENRSDNARSGAILRVSPRLATAQLDPIPEPETTDINGISAENGRVVSRQLPSSNGHPASQRCVHNWRGRSELRRVEMFEPCRSFSVRGRMEFGGSGPRVLVYGDSRAAALPRLFAQYRTLRRNNLYLDQAIDMYCNKERHERHTDR